MDGDINKALDILIQLGREADTASIKVGIITAKAARLKRYPQGSLTKYQATFSKMREIVSEIDAQAIKINDKLHSIYADDLNVKHPEVETPKPQRKRLSDADAYDLTDTRAPKRRSVPRPKKEKVVFDFD